MKLAYITNSRIPTEKAHGYQVCKMCLEFSRLGVEVLLYFPTRKNDIEDNIFNYYKINNNFKTKKIKSFDFISLERWLFFRGYWLQNIYFLIKLFLNRPARNSLIYTRDVEIAFLFKLLKYKVAYENHRVPKKKRLFKFLARNCDKIIVLTFEIKQLFIKMGVEENKIIISPDGVDLNIFDINANKEQARDILKLPKDKIILGYTGSFTTMGEDKGIADIIKSLRRLDDNIIFMGVGGSSSDQNYYKKIAKERGLQDRVLFFNKVDLKKLAIYQKACDILLMPFPWTEHYAYFMSPLKMFEYMASLRPIIASDLPSVRDVLNDRNCFLCKPGDYHNLALTIQKVINNSAQAKNIAKQAFEDVKKYTWSKRAKNIINFIK
jgi:glycosyltransferase involved in cell wall biosynthesis